MNTKRIITISRQYGSGGREIGAMLAKELAVPFYDRELISMAAEKSGISESFFENAEKDRAGSIFGAVFGGPYEPPLSDKVYFAQCEVIREVAEKGPCIIVGRCANHVLSARDDVLNVFVYADAALRAKRAVEVYHDPAEKVAERIASIDKKRSAYYNYYTDSKYGQPENYQLCIDAGAFGIQKSVDFIRMAYENI